MTDQKRFVGGVVRASDYSLLLLVFCLPLYKKLVPLFIVIWLVSRLAEALHVDRFRHLRGNWLHLLLVAFFVVHLWSLLFTDDMRSGWFDLQVKLSILLFPLLGLGLDNPGRSDFRTILKCFVIGNAVAVIICLAVAAYTYLNTGQNTFFYTHFSAFMHPSYFAMYLCLALVMVYHLLKTTQSPRTFYLAAVPLFLVAIYLLSSKSGLLVTALLIFAWVFNAMKQRTNLWLSVLFTLALFSAGGFILMKNQRFNEAVQTVRQIENYQPQVYGSIYGRIFLWQTAIRVIAEHPHTGVGAGDVRQALYENYQDKGLAYAEQINLNVHNQYLETFVAQGIPGFLLLLLLFSLPVVFRGALGYTLPGFFLVITGINFLFESMLNTQAGVVYYAFFYTLLMSMKAVGKPAIR